MDLGEVGWGGMDWVDLTWNSNQWRAIVNMVMNEEWCLLGCCAMWLL
jgi:hypothetical protein